MNIGPVELIVIAIILGLLLIFAYRGFRIDEGYLTRWETSAGVQLPEASRSALRSYLVSGRRFRTAGALAGWLLIPGYGLVTGREFPLDNGLVLALAGYLLGAVLAEVVFHRPGRRSGAALLVPRRLTDYLPGYVLVLQRGLALASVLLVVAYVLSPYPNVAIPQPSVAGFATLGAAGILVATVVELLQRMIVSRRQPVTDEHDVALDDAMRSSSAHVVAGGGVGMLLIVVGAEVAVFAAIGGILGIVFGALSFLLFMSAVFFWLDLIKPQGFKVQRGSGHGASA